MAEQLRFHGWQPSGVYDLDIRGKEDGRLRVALPLTLRDRLNPTDHVQGTIEFFIAGPRDVLRLQASAITGTYPAPNSIGVETSKCVYVEFSATDLPWRYTPDPVDKSAPDVWIRRRPWIVLIVGRTDNNPEIRLQNQNTVSFTPEVADAHPLSDSARWAHIQDDRRRPLARLLSPRPLEENAEYVAAIVPAFNEQGEDSWISGASPTLPCYYAWRFNTGETVGFEILASRLKPGVPIPTLGTAPVSYKRTDPPATLSVRGALAPINGTDQGLEQAVVDSVVQLTEPLEDPRGRPIVGLPLYGEPWSEEPTATRWGAATSNAVNGDPRHRGVAGLGLWAGVELQEQIMEAATEQVGALDIAAQRIRHLTLGLLASRSLWRRRLPEDSAQRLLVFGPTMRRIRTQSGSTVLDHIAGGDRPLPPALFSTAARRVLRYGPARTALAAPTAMRPSHILQAANTCPDVPRRVFKGLPHVDWMAELLGLDPPDAIIRRALSRGSINPTWLILQLLLSLDPPDEIVCGARDCFDLNDLACLIWYLLEAVQASEWSELQGDFLARILQRDPQDWPFFPLLEILIAIEAKDKETVIRLVENFDFNVEPDTESLLNFGSTLLQDRPPRICRPVNDLVELERRLSAAIDPTPPHSLVVRRVLKTIEGLDDQALAPVEVCVGIDLPVWTFLRDRAPDWLLPGANGLEEDAVVAVQSNQTFVDAFLLGLNTQVLGELRWRNIPIATGCTPMRMFWGQIDVEKARHKADIRGVEIWPPASALGSTDHQELPTSGNDLVLVFKSDLFRLYPRTLVYIAPKKLKQDTNTNQEMWDVDPPFDASRISQNAQGRDGERLIPIFQGNIGDDITFFRFDLDPNEIKSWWIVLEEPSSGYGFHNSVDSIIDSDPNIEREKRRLYAAATNGAEFAKAAFNNPTRVLLRGDCLIR